MAGFVVGSSNDNVGRRSRPNLRAMLAEQKRATLHHTRRMQRTGFIDQIEFTTPSPQSHVVDRHSRNAVANARGIIREFLLEAATKRQARQERTRTNIPTEEQQHATELRSAILNSRSVRRRSHSPSPPLRQKVALADARVRRVMTPASGRKVAEKENSGAAAASALPAASSPPPPPPPPNFSSLQPLAVAESTSLHATTTTPPMSSACTLALQVMRDAQHALYHRQATRTLRDAQSAVLLQANGNTTTGGGEPLPPPIRMSPPPDDAGEPPLTPPPHRHSRSWACRLVRHRIHRLLRQRSRSRHRHRRSRRRRHHHCRHSSSRCAPTLSRRGLAAVRQARIHPMTPKGWLPRSPRGVA